jgi:hypothetical protein
MPEVCELLEEKKFYQRKVMNDCLMMSYWCRRAIKYPQKKYFLKHRCEECFRKS